MIFKSKSSRTEAGAKAAAAMKADEDADRRNRRAGPTIITSDVIIEGKLITSGELQIDGTLHGDIRAASVVVDSNGSIRGEVVAEEIVVRGRIIGPLHAIHIHIYADAHVEGDIVHETISIENGAFIEGSIHRAEDPIDVADSMHAMEPDPYLPGTREPLRTLESPDEPKFRPDIEQGGFRPADLMRTTQSD
ncbi:cytoskeletal protein CcmA (bactofilin family) [Rhodoligotrophos appendicifer]|uniref:bactofilin family protein n=1 Tax=Rhodoligotrophos appendicifer TaxID=987056 RepID=UPI001478AC5D|nr:polymer-forming cytoskeletal protein [Rhodoligotrophos appendicifer]